MAHFIQFIKSGDPLPRLGLVQGQQVVDLTEAMPAKPRDLVLLLGNGNGPTKLKEAEALAAQAPASAMLALGELQLLPPVLHPGKIVCMGLNYADHAAEGGHARPEYPSFFLRGATSIIGHNAPIIRPKASTRLDYEAELAIIIGQRARHLTKANALDCVAGYACFNDGSIRDYQRKTNQWTIGKNFDGTGPFGPWMVTADALPPGAAGLRIQSRLNGKVMQDSNTGLFLWDVVEALCIITECMTLEPGDVIITGTPAGVGYARTPPVWMAPGDICEIEIEGIGTLSNPIADE
ncbi:MAG: fumarylacetoacetate hydrolase family protein [Gammaproteobacteria bacterium]|nr:fumarylacetoacetate hydrolase family protein [Gammaproteobacteria bacterium]MBU0787628.1 fumarylacetoacetate hydrolase family protein [Gammaproteobacteria bacterium]MBU0814902.1 fumarylacetoacetate hydrolase family protein [Gammaproteobacteria bacterium]MBU1785990.1 fumarylacetoacetate hydrolase family protein [Gammaproteobacteria bacterium]